MSVPLSVTPPPTGGGSAEGRICQGRGGGVIGHSRIRAAWLVTPPCGSRRGRSLVASDVVATASPRGSAPVPRCHEGQTAGEPSVTGETVRAVSRGRALVRPSRHPFAHPDVDGPLNAWATLVESGYARAAGNGRRPMRWSKSTTSTTNARHATKACSQTGSLRSGRPSGTTRSQGRSVSRTRQPTVEAKRRDTRGAQSDRHATSSHSWHAPGKCVSAERPRSASRPGEPAAERTPGNPEMSVTVDLAEKKRQLPTPHPFPLWACVLSPPFRTAGSSRAATPCRRPPEATVPGVAAVLPGGVCRGSASADG